MISKISIYSNKNYSLKSKVKKPPKKQNPKKQIYFSGLTLPVNYMDLGIQLDNKPISAEDGIKVFELLKNGSYLDSYDDDVNEPDITFSNPITRYRNLEFLSRITHPKEQEKFISYYKKLTDFPNLEAVSKKMETEFINACKNTSEKLEPYSFGIEKQIEKDQNPCEVLWAGYNDTCSIGHKKALPGSDIDGAFVVIRGTDDDKINEHIANVYRGQLWSTTDQRILSYNHSSAVPHVYTLKQIKDLAAAAQKVTDKFSQEQLDKYAQLKHEENENYFKSSQFNLKLAHYFPSKSKSDYFDPNNPTKSHMKDFGFFAEVFKEGKTLIETDDEKTKQILDEIKNSDAVNCSNLTQIQVRKNSNKAIKTKLKIREQMSQDFNKWPVEKQYSLIKTLIKNSCKMNDYNFDSLFSNTEGSYDNLQAVISALIK